MNAKGRQINPPIALMLGATIVIHSFSFLSLKYATLQSGLVAMGLIGCGVGFMAARAILWQRLLALGELSYIYPFTALVQVIILFYAVVLFGESFSLGNFVGIALMLAGTLVMADK